MDRRSVFFDEWLRSLRAQYQHVLRTGDSVTLPSLTEVMLQVGFGEEELRQLRLDATMRADEVADDFVPDLTILEAESSGKQPDATSQFDAKSHAFEPDPEVQRHESGQVYPTVELPTDDDDELEPMTFADSLEPQHSDLDDEPLADDSSEPTDDSDAPQQVNLLF